MAPSLARLALALPRLLAQEVFPTLLAKEADVVVVVVRGDEGEGIVIAIFGAFAWGGSWG